MYLLNLRSAKTASLEPRDYKAANSLYFDYRPDDNFDSDSLSSEEASDEDDMDERDGGGDFDESSSSGSASSDSDLARRKRRRNESVALAKKARLLAKARKKNFKMMKLRAGIVGHTNDHLRSEVAGESLLERMRECDTCGALSKPLLN